MAKVLMVDQDMQHATKIATVIHVRGMKIELCTSYPEAIRKLKEKGGSIDVVVICVSQKPRQVLECLRQMNEIDLKFGRSARQILCIAENFLDPDLELDIEASGARVVYER